MTRGARVVALLAVLLGATAVLAVPAGRRPLVFSDEARYALLAREAVEDGRWILPRVRDQVYLNKPPLFFWAVAAASWPVGRVTELTAGIPSLLSAVATLLAVFAIGRLLWGHRVGLVAMVVLATAPFYFFMAHQVLTDVMLTAWLTWALYFYLAAARADTSRRALVGFYACVGGGLLTKGPVALVVLVVAAVVTVTEEGWSGIRRLRPVMGLGILALWALPWLALYAGQRERSYVGAVVGAQYVNWVLHRKANPLTEAASTVLRFLPWSAFLPAAALWWWCRPDRDRRRLLTWTASLLVLVGLSGEERARYFTPVFPPAAIVIAEYLGRAGTVRGWAGRRGLAASLAGLLAATLLAVGAFRAGVIEAPASGPDVVFFPPTGWERSAMAALALAAPALGLLALRRAGAAAAACVGLGMGGLLLVEGVTYPPRFARRSDVPGFSRTISAYLGPGAAVVAYPDANLAWDFYLRHPVRELADPRGLREFLAVPRPDVLLIQERAWVAARDGADPSWRELRTGSIADRRMVVVVSRG